MAKSPSQYLREAHKKYSINVPVLGSFIEDEEGFTGSLRIILSNEKIECLFIRRTYISIGSDIRRKLKEIKYPTSVQEWESFAEEVIKIYNLN